MATQTYPARSISDKNNQLDDCGHSSAMNMLLQHRYIGALHIIIIILLLHEEDFFQYSLYACRSNFLELLKFGAPTPWRPLHSHLLCLLPWCFVPAPSLLDFWISEMDVSCLGNILGCTLFRSLKWTHHERIIHEGVLLAEIWNSQGEHDRTVTDPSQKSQMSIPQ